MQYYGTMLPRIPVLIERKMKVQLLLHEASKEQLEEGLVRNQKTKQSQWKKNATTTWICLFVSSVFFWFACCSRPLPRR